MSFGSPSPPPTSPRQAGPGRSGRLTPLILGAASFALVFLLIISGTVAFLVLRPSGGDPTAGPATPSESETTPTPVTTPPEEEEEEESLRPTDEGKWCWRPQVPERTSQNPSGKLRGGGLDMIPPEIFDDRSNRNFWSFSDDMTTASATVEGSWVSTIGVGRLTWQPGYEYPGDEAAATRLIDCVANAPIWGDTENRKLTERYTRPVVINGVPGYQATATMTFDSDLEKTDASLLYVIVLDTDGGPSVFGADIARGVEDHEQAVHDAIDSLTEVR